MSSLRGYYLSRIIVSLAFCTAFFLAGASLWQAGLLLGAALLFFYWAPRSGRYSVYPERGATALRRDERTQGVTDKSGRNAWIAVTLGGAALALYSRSVGASLIPVQWLSWLLILGVIIYFASDLLLRRA